MAQKFDTVLFDVDGTLVDSTYHHTVAWARAFEHFDLQPALWRVHRAIGMGGDKLVGHICGDEVAEKLGDDLSEAWGEEYEKLVGSVRAFDGAADAVRAVRDRGYKVALASSGKEKFTDASLEMLGLKKSELDAVTSSDDAENSKPDPDILQVALKKAGGEHGILIGDSTWDVKSAERLDMRCVGVRSGGFSEHELTGAGAIFVVDAVTNLRDGAWIDKAQP